MKSIASQRFSALSVVKEVWTIADDALPGGKPTQFTVAVLS